MMISERDQSFKKYVAHMYSKLHWEIPNKLLKFTDLLEIEKNEGGFEKLKDLLTKVDQYCKDTRTPNSLEFLEEFLFSTTHNPPIVHQVHHDMDAPLSHYFIHTSLKSYFTGNPFYQNKYGVEPIIDALGQGVRVVELDLSRCGKDGICVRPSRDLEKPLPLQACLDCIRDHAFTQTSYPLIITFKDDLKPDLQYKASQMITQTFGDMIYDHGHHSLEFRSPEQLKNKILISRRPPKMLLYANDGEKRVHEVQNGVEADPIYQSLVAFRAVEPRGMLRKALTDKTKDIKEPGWYENEVITFTRTKFLRTRPKRKLLLNAPYKPQRAWMHGVQLIALSRQEDREKLWLMQGMFRANGGCGYVKKPEFLLNRSCSGVCYPTENPVVEKTLNVKVYMGDGWQMDFKKNVGRRSSPDLYVLISIAGVTHDEKIMRTTIKTNEWTPTWGEEFTFPLTYPDLALLSIEVYNHEFTNADGFCGQTCLPVSELVEGIRAVPLYDEKGEACEKTMLLIRFKWSYPI